VTSLEASVSSNWSRIDPYLDPRQENEHEHVKG